MNAQQLFNQACLTGNLEFAKSLYKNVQNINYDDPFKNSFFAGQYDIVRYLLSLSPLVNYRIDNDCILRWIIDNKKCTDMKYIVDLYLPDDIVKIGGWRVLTQLYVELSNCVKKKYVFRQACKHNLVSVVDVLLELYPDTDIKDNRYQALVNSCCHDNVDLVRLISANINFSENQIDYAFDIACRHGCIDVVEYLMKNFNCDYNRGFVASCRYNHKGLARYFIDNYDDLDYTRDNHFAVKHLIFTSSYRLLFNIIDLYDINQLVPVINFCYKYGATNAVEYIVRRRQITSLIIDVKYQQRFNQLLKSSNYLYNIFNNINQYTCKTLSKWHQQFIQRRTNSDFLSKSHMCSFTKSMPDIDFAFRHANRVGRIDVMKWLYDNWLSTGYKIDIDNEFLTACECNRFKSVQYIVQTWPSVNLDYYNGSAFRSACKNNNYKLVKYLMSINTDIYIRVNNDEILRMCCDLGHTRLAALFLPLCPDFRIDNLQHIRPNPSVLELLATSIQNHNIYELTAIVNLCIKKNYLYIVDAIIQYHDIVDLSIDPDYQTIFDAAISRVQTAHQTKSATKF